MRFVHFFALLLLSILWLCYSQQSRNCMEFSLWKPAWIRSSRHKPLMENTFFPCYEMYFNPSIHKHRAPGSRGRSLASQGIALLPSMSTLLQFFQTSSLPELEITPYVPPDSPPDSKRSSQKVCAVFLLRCPSTTLPWFPRYLMLDSWFTPIDGPDMTLKCLPCEKRTFKANADCVRKHVARYHQQDYYNHLPSNVCVCVLLYFMFFFVLLELLLT